jgi:hypothetical protein
MNYPQKLHPPHRPPPFGQDRSVEVFHRHRQRPRASEYSRLPTLLVPRPHPEGG